MLLLKISQWLFVFLISIPQLIYAEQPQAILAPGYSPLKFIAPEAGSYLLPPLGQAANGQVLNTKNTGIELYDLMGDKIVLLSFIYSTCSDVNGCPLATAVFHKIKRKLENEPQLANQLRLLTLSFNPEHDTPKVMESYGKGLQSPSLDWQFLTTRSEQEILPILQHYRQSIQKIVDEDGQSTGTFSHILRVYLIDKNKKIRNIYSVSFLHADTLINDVKTLLADTYIQTDKVREEQAIQSSYYQAGDNKFAYEKKDYKTQSIALTDRIGKRTDLIQTINNPPLGLPKLAIPDNNPISKAKISLGKKLFFDRRLSINNTFSCAMCHIPEQGFSSNEMATSVGVEGRTVRRNAPTLYNVAYYQTFFHDGRENTLEQQVWGPLLARNEMANPSIGYVINKINQLPEYQELFEKTFNRPAGMETIGQAIASYQRTLNSANSSFDRWFFSKQEKALTQSAQQGYQVFIGKGQCSQCHSLTASDALFTDNQFHNTGVGYQRAMKSTKKTIKVQLAPGVFADVDNQVIESVSESKGNDLGRYEVTQDPADRWKYKTPSLRNISLTAPYMHDGSILSLEQIIRFYNQGGIENETLDPLIKPLNLSESEIKDLLAFLKSLTGSNVQQLISDAYTQTIGDISAHEEISYQKPK
ncbi:MAG: SCO family protein [Methylococcaceae bacterium]|nr:SCO family protein [Methylococcaceae bacterium]